MTPAPCEAEPTAPGLADVLRRFDLSSRNTVVVAVSGGSDSTALLLLAREWRERASPATRLLAATVDHRLRPESSAEAAAVAAMCAGLGIEHLTLPWTGRKPATGMQAAAREARLRLLTQAAAAAGTDIVLTGHTLDDQAETIAMRAGRGPGIGLAGMAPATLLDGSVWVVRPLLATRRETLRDFLRSRRTGWIDDPSNENPAFERVRLRERDRMVDPSAIAAAGRQRRDLAARAGTLLDGHAGSPSRGLTRIDPTLFDAADRDAAVHAFRALLAAVGGGDHLPDVGRATALFGRVRQPLRATLARTVVDARRAGVFLFREQRNLPGPAGAADGMIWDGRFRIRTAGPAGLRIASAAGAVAAAEGDAVPPSLARAALAAEPALLSGDGTGTLIDASSSPVAAARLAPPWSRFLPCFDLPLARAVARIVGAPPFPEPPCRGHNGAKA